MNNQLDRDENDDFFITQLEWMVEKLDKKRTGWIFEKVDDKGKFLYSYRDPQDSDLDFQKYLSDPGFQKYLSDQGFRKYLSDKKPGLFSLAAGLTNEPSLLVPFGICAGTTALTVLVLDYSFFDLSISKYYSKKAVRKVLHPKNTLGSFLSKENFEYRKSLEAKYPKPGKKFRNWLSDIGFQKSSGEPLAFVATTPFLRVKTVLLISSAGVLVFYICTKLKKVKDKKKIIKDFLKKYCQSLAIFYGLRQLIKITSPKCYKTIVYIVIPFGYAVRQVYISFKLRKFSSSKFPL
mmetsp:Transcript_18731/g.24733  ORF Transcript_18731/g.24733 Transcript_18731/m.24733 type:complete len:292 (-) Transcript_18731:4-879(-)